MLYHVTTQQNAAAIQRDGFDDRSEERISGKLLRGVFLCDEILWPMTDTDPVAIAVDLSLETIAECECTLDHGYRRWIVPCRIVNQANRRLIYRDPIAEIEVLLPAVVAEIAQRIDDPVFMLAFIRDQDSLPAATRQFYNLISQIPALAAFRSGFFRFGRSQMQTRPDTLIVWAVRRTLATSAEQAVADLRRYLSATEIPAKLRTLIAGVTAESQFGLGTGARFLPRGQFPLEDAVFLREWNRVANAQFGFIAPTAVIETDFVESKQHYEAADLPAEWPSDMPADVNHADELTALRLIACAASRLSAWIVLPEWCPVLHGSMWGNPPPQLIMSEHVLSQEAISDLPVVISRLRGLELKTRRAVELGIHRISVASTQQSQVDRAVDLRIAYEVALGVGDSGDADTKGELRYRLAMRAARLLGRSKTERIQIFNIGRDLYDLCSGAVHSGDFSRDWRPTEVTEVLEKGREVVRRVLMKIVMEGAPDWSGVVME